MFQVLERPALTGIESSLLTWFQGGVAVHVLLDFFFWLVFTAPRKCSAATLRIKPVERRKMLPTEIVVCGVAASSMPALDTIEPWLRPSGRMRLVPARLPAGPIIDCHGFCKPFPVPHFRPSLCKACKGVNRHQCYCVLLWCWQLARQPTRRNV